MADIPEIPENIKIKYKETFEIDIHWILKAAAYRGKWIDQSQSVNIFFNGLSGEELSNLYMYAWQLGLKTTYYLRTQAATQTEKSTVDTAEYGSTHIRHSEGKEVIQAILEEIVEVETSEEAPQLVLVSATSSSQIETPPAERKPNLYIAADTICEACE